MATFTILVSIPESESPTLAADMAKHVKRGLEEHLRYTVAHVDALRGDHLTPWKAQQALRKTHLAVAGSDYSKDG